MATICKQTGFGGGTGGYQKKLCAWYTLWKSGLDLKNCEEAWLGIDVAKAG